MSDPPDNQDSQKSIADRVGWQEGIVRFLLFASLLVVILLGAYYILGIFQSEVLVGLGLPNPSLWCPTPSGADAKPSSPTPSVIDAETSSPTRSVVDAKTPSPAPPVADAKTPDRCVSASDRLKLFLLFLVATTVGVVLLFGRERKKWSRQERIGAWIVAAIFVVLILTVLGTVLPPGQIWTLARALLLVIFTILPPAFFVVFVTMRGGTLWDEFCANLYRLEPAHHRRLGPLYQGKFAAIYGAPDKQGFVAALPRGEAAFPVVLATLIIGTGWWLFYMFSAPSEPAVSVAPAWLRYVWQGEATVFTYGFLGAYFYSLSMLFRRYAQSDLKSTAYLHVCVRILGTWIFAFVLSQLPWSAIWKANTAALGEPPEYQQTMAILAFIVGISPEIFWQVLGRFLHTVVGVVSESFTEEYPLKEIRGISFWVETRLLEEGIDNVQNLVSANILDLLLRTSLPAERVVDWVDQAILKLHLWEAMKAATKADRANSLYWALDACGISTASGLLRSLGRMPMPSGDFKRLERIDAIKTEVLPDTLGAAIDGDPKMYHVKAWCYTEMELEKTLKEDAKHVISELRKPLPLPLTHVVPAPDAAGGDGQATQ